jgi:hypothetical protein
MMRALRSLVFAAALLLLGQAPPAAGQEQLAWRALGEGRYLDAVDHARRAAFRADTGERIESGYTTWAQIHPFIGGVLDPAAFDPRPSAPLDPGVADRFRRAELRDAVREIAARAAAARVVILNEAHDSPRDRAFALEVARALRPLGYSMLAAEAIINFTDAAERDSAMARLAADGYPRRGTGTYVLDPVFADFLRQSLALGYRPFAYESTGFNRSDSAAGRITRREQAQAENLAEILRLNPGAKLLVFVGYGHVMESPRATVEGRLEWMAARLKRLTGLDPLTIDQTLFDETDPTARAYRGLLNPRLGRRPAVPFLGGAPLLGGSYGSGVDLQVVHPPLRLIRGRPDWMRRVGRRPVEIPRRLLPASGRRLVQAFVADEPADAIPLDQVVVEAGRPAPPLMLPRGRRVRWAFQDPLPIVPPDR